MTVKLDHVRVRYLMLVNQSFTEGSLFIAGFAQVGEPHTALLLSIDSNKGHIAHIHAKSGTWAYQFRQQNLSGSLTLTTLLKIHDVSAGAITPEQLDAVASKVQVNSDAPVGECLKWVKEAVEALHSEGLVNLGSGDNLLEEFSTFAGGNRAYATSSRFPNVMESQHCT
ncbi:hypothetical protein EDD22DRAFT_982092 [Suillus occidentalis]|nr:hypothetical protein EDD22DRAFT_982092 [Suillus occidentalis]